MNGDVRTVDVHAHILCPEVMGAAGAAGPAMGTEGGTTFFRSGEYVLRGVRFADSPFSDVAQRLALMDGMGIDHHVLSPNPLTYFYAQPAAVGVAFARAQNDAIAAVASRRRHAANSGSTQARATIRAPRAGLRESSTSIWRRISPGSIRPRSARSSLMAVSMVS